MVQSRNSRAVLLIATILAIYTGSQPLGAMDLGRFGTKSTDTKSVDKETAIEDAMKLVNSMNDAATGTITSYGPGHGPKKPDVVTCDEIMAKSLVVANEEKAAIIAEKAAVVKAASLLSDRIDELTQKLVEADERVAAVEVTYTDLEQATQARIKEAEEAAAEELERMKLSMSALKNATAAHIERVEAVASEQLQMKDDKMNDLVKENKDEINRIRAETEEEKVRLLQIHQEYTDGLRQEIADSKSAHEGEIEELKAMYQDEIEMIKHQAAEDKLYYEREMAEANADAEEKIAKIEREASRMMDELVESAQETMSAERDQHEETQKKLKAMIEEAKEKENALSTSIEELTTESNNLQGEVTFWKDTHASQGYCNTTLIREDSRKLVMNAIANTKNGFSGTQKLISDGLKDKSANVVQFIEEELIPKVEKAMGEACEIALETYNELSSKAVVLYNEHLAAAINEKIIPVLDEHLYPVWHQKAVPLIDQCSEHVSPIVKTIDTETRKKVTNARAGIAPRLENLASSFIEIAQKNNLFDKLPKFISTQLMQAAEDGHWALDMLVHAYLVIIAILFRSTIFRIIWFFCPLRLFFRKAKPAKSKSSSSDAPVKSEQNGSVKNGGKKAKVY